MGKASFTEVNQQQLALRAQRPKMVQRTEPMPQRNGPANRFGDIVLGRTRSLEWPITENQPTHQGTRERATGAMSGGALDALADEPVEIVFRRQQ